MIDFHSHILPRLDDGSKSVEESLAMLSTLREQGIDTVLATPHFYADKESLETFLKRRNESVELLKSALPETAPNILIGAEVLYYPGIVRMEGLKKLCIEGTNLLLLEMPFSRWTEYTVREMIELASRGNMTLVLAHLDRYLSYQTKDTLRKIYSAGMLMQFNASFFLNMPTKRKALSMLKHGEINFVGSDCHNMTSRPPRIGEAYAAAEKKLGQDFLANFNEYGRAMLKI